MWRWFSFVAPLAWPEVAPFPGQPFSVTPETSAGCKLQPRGLVLASAACAHTQTPSGCNKAPLLGQAPAIPATVRQRMWRNTALCKRLPAGHPLRDVPSRGCRPPHCGLRHGGAGWRRRLLLCGRLTSLHEPQAAPPVRDNAHVSATAVSTAAGQCSPECCLTAPLVKGVVFCNRRPTECWLLCLIILLQNLPGAACKQLHATCCAEWPVTLVVLGAAYPVCKQ